MAINKYVRDYRLVETVDERGRLRTVHEYVGAAYVYTDAAAFAAAKRTAGVLCALGWLCFLGAMLPDSMAMRRLYIALPFIFSALPLALLTETVLSAPAPGGTLERRHADRLRNRYPASAAFTVILPAVCLIGEAVSVLPGAEPRWGDAVFSLCAAVLAACGVILYKKRRGFDTRQA